jgi:succinoglycan biosynthesis transport protein ExoP
MPNYTTVNAHFLDYWHVIKIRRWLIALIFLLVVSSVGVATYFAPRQYNSFATIDVQTDMTPIHIRENQAEQRTLDDPKEFSQTQIQIILRKGVLYPVIDRLNLQTKWAKNGKPLEHETAYEKLRTMVNVEGVRNTNLIAINVFSADPHEAALIANTIAQVYMEQRITEQTTIVSKSLEQLRDEVKQNEKAVDQAYAEASKLRTEENIIDPNPDSLEPSGRYGVEDSSVITNQEKVNEAKSQVAMLRSKTNQLDHVQWEDLMRASGQLNLNDPIIQAKLPLYQAALVDKERLLKSGLGPNHPEVKALEAQIETIAAQLREQMDSLRKGIHTELAIAENSLKAMQVNLSDSQTEQQAMKTVSAQYLNAKYKYIEERKLLEMAKSRLSTESIERRMPQSAAFIRDTAEVALFPSKPRVLTNMLFGIAAGLVLGISFAFFLEHIDTSVKTMDDVAKFLEVPVLGVIPKGIKSLANNGQNLPDAEAYRILKTNVDLYSRKNGATCFNVTSGGMSEGKSTTVCNLATAWTAGGRRVLVIDGDMHRPTQHRLFGVENRLGLSHCLEGAVTLDEVMLPTTVDDLYLVTAGLPPRGARAGSMNSESMKQLIDTARARFDVVLIDSPPILGVSDALILTSLTDYSIVVIQQRRFPRSMLLRVKTTIEDIGGRLLGVVLNKVHVSDDQNYHYSTNYVHYYTGKKT